MIVARTLLACLAFVTGLAASFGQQPDHFYNIDTERRVEGTIKQLIFESRYETSAPFLILLVEENRTGNVYKVEISPAWFFNHDLHKGEKVKITGSLYTKDDTLFIIARQLQVGGETFTLRDSRGFPSWRGGQMKGKVRRQGRGM
ncbi:MAG: hypothetical protein QHH14_09740 [Clostridiales bacterium]|jgi:hypothetical protein|nr:hypothetical protein [Clostridiales bacterium]